MKRKFIARTALNLLVLMLALSTSYAQISGSGNVVKQERNVGSFTGISVSSGIDLAVTQGTQNALVIEADDNIQEYIISEVEEGVLKIYVKPKINIHRSHSMNAYVTVSNLKSVSVSGGGDVKSVNKITSDDLAFSISGGGDLSFEFSANDTKCSVSGGGDVALEGETKEMNTSISGGGDLVLDLAMGNLMISMSGGGDAVIDGGRSGSEAKISMSGGGDLTLDIHADELAISVGGGGDASLSGSAEIFSGEMKSGGDLKAGDFQVQTASIELTGGSDAWIHVEKNLSVTGTGGAQVYVSGNPQIDATLTGGSKVHQK